MKKAVQILFLSAFSYIYCNQTIKYMQATEIWKDIPEFRGIYQVSSNGQIRGTGRFQNNGKFTHRIKPIKQFVVGTGYLMVHLQTSFRDYNNLSHRLVALVFIPNPEGKRCVNHKNGIKTDNRVENLEWVTYSENTIHALDNGLHKRGRARSKITQQTIDFVIAHRDILEQRDLAKMFNISQTTVWKIQKDILWKNESVKA